MLMFLFEFFTIGFHWEGVLASIIKLVLSSIKNLHKKSTKLRYIFDILNGKEILNLPEHP